MGKPSALAKVRTERNQRAHTLYGLRAAAVTYFTVRVPCPTCRQPQGLYCLTENGKPLGDNGFHAARIDTARALGRARELLHHLPPDVPL